MPDVISNSIGAILLAAGSSSRLGRPKQLLNINGQTLVRHAASVSLQAGCQPVIVVTGANSDAVISDLKDLPVHPIFHAGWSAGMGSSLRAGLSALIARDPEISAAIILVCDQPHLNSQIIRSLIDTWRAGGKPMAACEYAGAMGPPCCFGRSVFPQLSMIGDQDGAKRVLRSDPPAVAAFPWPGGATDLDTPDDVRKFEQTPPLKLIIFDCDGVLVDSEILSCQIDSHCLTEAGFPISSTELASRFIGMSAESVIQALSTLFSRPVPPGLNDLRRQRFMDASARLLQPMPGMANALAAIRVKYCVASSGHPQRIAHSLRVTGLREFFGEHLFSATMVQHGKPAPDLFLYAARQMGISPANCLVVEDSVAGVQAAKSAGMRVIGFTGGSHCQPDHAQRLLDAGADRITTDMGLLPECIEMW